MSDAMDPRHADPERRRRCPFDEGSCKAGDCPEHGVFTPPETPRARLRAKPEALAARREELAKEGRTLSVRVPNILLSVRLDDGTFESALSVPVDANFEEIQETAAAWMVLLQQALKTAKIRR